MYHCDVRITVWSKDAALGELARSVQAGEHVSYRIEVQTEAGEGLGESDVIVWDLGPERSPAELRGACRKDAAILYCASRAEMERFGPEDWAAIDGFCERPLCLPQVRRTLEHMLERLALRYEVGMTRTYLDTAIDSIPDMLWFKALDGTHVKVNRAFCSVVGKTREDVTGRDHCYIWGVSKEDFENGEASCRESEEAVIRARTTLQFTEAVKSSNGMRQFRTYKSPVFDLDGETILGTVGIGHDVTDLENMSTEIEILLRSMPYAILLWNKDGSILNVNTKFEEYFHVGKADILGRDYGTWMASAFEDQRFINSEGYVEAKVRLHNGAGKILEIHEDSIHDVFQNVVGKLCIYRDVTLERDLEAQILRSSNTDFLTGLYNRRCFYQYIHNNRGQRMTSLLYIDLDHFKQVNDTYGHKVGDAALKRTAELLKESFPEDFAARLGGDEFLVVRLDDCTREQLEGEARAFLARMQGVFRSFEQLKTMSASIGIAQSSDPGLDIDVLLQHSDLALYQAKQRGRAQYCFYA